jgi:hypothetical protein
VPDFFLHDTIGYASLPEIPSAVEVNGKVPQLTGLFPLDYDVKVAHSGYTLTVLLGVLGQLLRAKYNRASAVIPLLIRQVRD